MRQRLGQGAPGNVGGRQAHGDGGQPRARIGLELDKHLAGFVFRWRGVIQPAHHIGQRLAGDLRRKQPAAQRAVNQIMRQRRGQRVQLVFAKARAACRQRLLQGKQLRRLRAQGDAAGLIAGHQLRQLGVVQIGKRHLHPIAKAQLRRPGLQSGKLGQQGFKVPALDADFHGAYLCAKESRCAASFVPDKYIFKNNGLNFFVAWIVKHGTPPGCTPVDVPTACRNLPCIPAG